MKWTGGSSQQKLLSKQTQQELGLVAADGVVFVPIQWQLCMSSLLGLIEHFPYHLCNYIYTKIKRCYF